MALFWPADSAAMLQGLYDWARFGAAGARVVWAKQGAPGRSSPPAPPLPFVVIDLLVPPVEEGQLERVLEGAAIRVLVVQASTLYSVLVEGLPYVFTSSATPTLAEVVAGLSAALQAAPEITVEGLGLDTIVLLPRAGEAPVFAVQDETLLEHAVPEVLLGSGMGTLAVQVLADDGTAASMAKRIELSADASRGIELLDLAGWVGVTVEDVGRRDAFDDGRWEDRLGFDLRIRCRTRRVDAVQWVEQALVGTGIVGTLGP